MTTFTIGKLAARVGISAGTIRFYERKGLIKPTSRNESGYRLYSEDIQCRLYIIRQIKELGFSLDEIKDILFQHNSYAST